MRTTISTFLLLFAIIGISSKTVTIIDASDASPIPGATFFTPSGLIIGISDNNGQFKIPSGTEFPISLSCLGYTTSLLEASDSVAQMHFDTYQLPEVTVNPIDRPVIHMVCYMREFIGGVTGSDTTMCFNELMADFFIPVSKAKGLKHKEASSPRILNARMYSRVARKGLPDSIFKPKYRDDTFAWEHLIHIPADTVSIDNLFPNGQNYACKMGKHDIKNHYRRTANTLSIQTDLLADVKNHTASPTIFKLLGITLDINQLQCSWLYKPTPKNTVSPSGILSGTFAFEILGRGKWIKRAFNTKENVKMFGFYEIYPVSTQYLTVEQYKELSGRAAPTTPFQTSKYVTPLSPAIQNLVSSLSAK